MYNKIMKNKVVIGLFTFTIIACLLSLGFNIYFLATKPIGSGGIFNCVKNSVVELKAESEDVGISYGSAVIMSEVGTKSIKEYVRLAEQTAQRVIKDGIPAIRQVTGATANVFRYEVGNFYIHMAKSAKEIIIVSFGLL